MWCNVPLVCAAALLALSGSVMGHGNHGGHGHAHGGDAGGTTNIVQLTSSNFDELVGAEKGAIIEFYAPWCTHCKHLKPQFEKLASTYLGSEQVMVAMLNAEQVRQA
eukprot:SAG11_NODE_1802_length_4237_cov_4.045916_2_plen_107_part_00